MRGTQGIAVAVCAIATSASATEASLERRFLEALALIAEGQQQTAVVLLRALYHDAPTQRIRLELARALLLSSQLDEAKRLFVAAYNDHPPPDVRANILTYIDQIDRRRGKFILSLSIGHFANPLQQPGGYTFNSGGIDLSYEPNSAYRNLWGVTVGGQYQKQLENGVDLYSSAAYRSLPNDAADRFTGEVSIGKKFEGAPLMIKAGAYRFDQKLQSFSLPYIQATYTYALSSRTAIQPAVQAAYYAADAGQGLSGWQLNAFAPYLYAPTPAKVFSVGPSVVRHDVGLKEQSYTSIEVRASSALQTRRVNIDVYFQGRLTEFDATDPFWGQRREDEGIFSSVIFSSDTFRVGPLLPSLGLSCDVTRSNIQYYTLRSCDVLFEVRKIF